MSSTPQLTPAWTPLRYHKLQSKLWRTTAQFVAVAAGRGSGKTEIARRRIIRYLPVKKDWPDPIYFYGLPTIKQAKRVAWNKLLNLIPKDWIRKVNISDMTITTIFGSTLYVVGMDNPERVEGDQWDGCVLDESCDQRPNAFNLSVLPALTHKNGWCWRIGVPKRHGIGSRDFKRFYDLGCRSAINANIISNNNDNGTISGNNGSTIIIPNEDDEEDEGDKLLDSITIESYTWPSADILSPEKLAWYQENLDPRDFNEQFNATWESASGAIFYAYKDTEYPAGNLDSNITYRPDLPLIIGQDFNVDPMAWVICQHDVEKQRFNVIDELFIRNTNTPEALGELHKRYGHHQAGFNFFGDASSRARKTSASSTDYLITIQWINDGKFKGGRVYVLKKNPRIQDRFAACNALFCNAKGERRGFIHPRCKYLRQDLQDRQFKEGLTEPDDYGDIGHISDAFGYPVHRLFPISIKLTDKEPAVFAGRIGNSIIPGAPSIPSIVRR